MRMSLFFCFLVVTLVDSEPAESMECEKDSGSEECLMRMEFLQGKMQVDKGTAESESQLNLGKEDCKAYCSTKVSSGAKTWAQVCTWDACSGCSDCDTTTADTTTTTTTVLCKSYCSTKVSSGAKTWAQVCSWTDACSGCSDCDTTTPTTTTTTTTVWQSPYFAMTCSGTQILTTSYMTFSQYDAAVASVQTLYNSLSTTCTGTYCPQADFAGCVLRIAGHDFMDYKDDEGGSDGCIDFHDADNAGLSACIHEGEHGVSLADAYADYCTSISLADFIVIAAEAMMNVTRQNVLDDDATRSTVDFRSSFKWGRTTALSCSFAEGRLPNPENGCSAVDATFVQAMGLSWSEAAALSGVHTLGRAEVSNSGYNGWWSDAVNSRKFNNNYFISIVLKGWAPETSVGGNSAKNQWQRVDSGVDEAANGKEMMLDTDMCLYFTMDDDGEVEINAATALEKECNCTWPAPVKFANGISKYNDDKFCGSTDIPGGGANFPIQRALCCGSTFDSIDDDWIDCGLPVTPLGPAANYVKAFANDEDTWLTVFSRAWKTATTNGFSSLSKLKDD